jgi:hypothetical protein
MHKVSKYFLEIISKVSTSPCLQGSLWSQLDDVAMVEHTCPYKRILQHIQPSRHGDCKRRNGNKKDCKDFAQYLSLEFQVTRRAQHERTLVVLAKSLHEFLTL